MWWMTLTSLITLLPLFLLLLPQLRFPSKALPYLTLSGLFQALYYYSLGRAYEAGDLSLIYPIARSSPLILLILSILLLGEEVSPLGILGILLISLGLYSLHLRRLKEILYPIKGLRGSGSKLALLSAFFTACYSLIDKVGVVVAGPLLYAFWLDAFAVTLLTPITLRRKHRLLEVAGKRLPQVLLSGSLMRLSYLLVLLAMPMAQVSYLVALRQLSVIIGALIGIGLLGERDGGMRLLGSTLVFAGAFLIGTLA